MSKKIAGLLIVLAVLSGFWYFLYPKNVTSYQNEKYGIAFDYSNDYVLEERDLGNGERFHYSITLIDKNFDQGINVATEGPTAITIDIFQNNLDKLSVSDWISNVSFSNYKLATTAKSPSEVAGKDAISYSWDGLYRGDSIVLEHNENIIMLSVTYLETGDKIKTDFKKLISTLKFE